MFKILFLGLCMFVKNDGLTQTVVIPDLTAPVSMTTPRGPTCVEPHIAYIAAPAENTTCSGCEILTDEKKVAWKVLYLRGDTVKVTGLNDPYKEVGFNIPRIKTYCRMFSLSIPPTATTLTLTNGTLSAQSDDNGVVTSTLSNENTEAAVIFEVRRGVVTETMTVVRHKEGSVEIRIANLYAAGHFKDKKKFPVLAENHWLAYYTLSATPVVCDLPSLSGQGAETTSACSNSGYP